MNGRVGVAKAATDVDEEYPGDEGNRLVRERKPSLLE